MWEEAANWQGNLGLNVWHGNELNGFSFYLISVRMRAHCKNMEISTSKQTKPMRTFLPHQQRQSKVQQFFVSQVIATWAKHQSGLRDSSVGGWDNPAGWWWAHLCHIVVSAEAMLGVWTSTLPHGNNEPLQVHAGVLSW